MPDTGETPLHAALCTTDRLAHDLLLRVLLGHSANPNCGTKPGVETGGFMRDCRTRGETPLHRAAAFGSEVTIQLLLDARADVTAKDMNGDSPADRWFSLLPMWHTPALDYARSTRLGQLVLGSGFDPRDFGAYTIGIPGFIWFDRRWTLRSRSERS